MSTPTRANVRVLMPSSAAEAVRMGATDGATYVAAGTWLQPQWEKAGQWPTMLIDVSGLPELDHWAFGTDAVRIGALTTLARLCNDDRLARELPMLGGLCRRVAGPGVRHLATLGGNVVSRGDLVPVLLALDASVTVAGPAGRNTVPLAAWLTSTDRDALVCSVDIPLPAGRRAYAEKLGRREAFSPPVVTVAACLQLDRHRIASAALAIGGGPPPRRLPGTEALLADQAAAAPPWRALEQAIEDDLSDLGESHPATASRGLLLHGMRQALATEIP